MKKYLPILIILLIGMSAFAQDDVSKNTAKRAQFIIDLIDDVQRPAESTSTAFVITVEGNPSFLAQLRELAGRKSTPDRKIEVRPFSMEANLTGSHMLIISTEDLTTLAAVLKKALNLPILTVSDVEGFARYGVMIELLKPEGGGNTNVEYAVNKMALKRAGLSVSENFVKKAKKTYG